MRKEWQSGYKPALVTDECARPSCVYMCIMPKCARPYCGRMAAHHAQGKQLVSSPLMSSTAVMPFPQNPKKCRMSLMVLQYALPPAGAASSGSDAAAAAGTPKHMVWAFVYGVVLLVAVLLVAVLLYCVCVWCCTASCYTCPAALLSPLQLLPLNHVTCAAVYPPLPPQPRLPLECV